MPRRDDKRRPRPRRGRPLLIAGAGLLFACSRDLPHGNLAAAADGFRPVDAAPSDGPFGNLAAADLALRQDLAMPIDLAPPVDAAVTDSAAPVDAGTGDALPPDLIVAPSDGPLGNLATPSAGRRQP